MQRYSDGGICIICRVATTHYCKICNLYACYDHLMQHKLEFQCTQCYVPTCLLFVHGINSYLCRNCTIIDTSKYHPDIRRRYPLYYRNVR